MGAIAPRKAAYWTVDLFRAFLDTRPDEERWELIDGVPVMMTPPTFIHNRLASNLEHLLNEALRVHRPDLLAFQRMGLDLFPERDSYQPEPDVSVVDADIDFGDRYARRFYLAAEIVSGSDERRSGDTTRLDLKRALYRDHPSCLTVVTVEQERMRVRLELRGEDGWTALDLGGADEPFAIDAFGLRCRVGDLYRNSPLAR